MKLWMIYLSLNVFKSEARTLPGAKGSRPSGRRLLYGSTISHLARKEGNPANISSWMCNINVISISIKNCIHDNIIYYFEISHLGGKEGNPADPYLCDINIISMIPINIEYPWEPSTFYFKISHLGKEERSISFQKQYQSKQYLPLWTENKTKLANVTSANQR